MDVNLTVGGSNTFDVPPGKSSKSYEFSLPVGGRLLGVGGHMHDYGVRVRLARSFSPSKSLHTDAALLSLPALAS